MMTSAKLRVNLNFISQLHGLPLSGTLKIDGKNFESNILISRQGLDTELMNFEKLLLLSIGVIKFKLKSVVV